MDSMGCDNQSQWTRSSLQHRDAIPQSVGKGRGPGDTPITHIPLKPVVADPSVVSPNGDMPCFLPYRLEVHLFSLQP